jgi:hypothetical protein
VGNSFGLGTDFGFSMNSHKSDQGDTITFKSQSISMWVTPGMRFYFREAEKKWRPYMFLNGGFQYSGTHSSGKFDNAPTMDYDNKSSSKGFRGYTGAGMAWFFSDHAAFDIRLRVLDLYPGTDSNGDPKMQFGYSPDFMIGVQAFFD